MSQEYVRPKRPEFIFPDVTEEEKEQGWREGRWKSYKQFKCIRCPFDTLERTVIEAHIYEDHILKERLMQQALLQEATGERPIAADLLDASGRKIETIEDPELRNSHALEELGGEEALARLYGIRQEED